MSDRGYLGIDHNHNNEWIVILVAEGKIGFMRRFKNTPADSAALVRFIGEHCSRPKICVTPASRAVLKLPIIIGGMPDVEVVLMSAAGLKMHHSWLTPAIETPYDSGDTCQAVMLAHCAERMV